MSRAKQEAGHGPVTGRADQQDSCGGRQQRAASPARAHSRRSPRQPACSQALVGSEVKVLAREQANEDPIRIGNGGERHGLKSIQHRHKRVLALHGLEGARTKVVNCHRRIDLSLQVEARREVINARHAGLPPLMVQSSARCPASAIRTRAIATGQPSLKKYLKAWQFRFLPLELRQPCVMIPHIRRLRPTI
jgi:hypothetical protein